MYGPVPPSPLNDPTVRSAIEAEKTQPKRLTDNLPPNDAQAVELLLTHYPWQEYGFRFGRWQRETFHELVWFPLNYWRLAQVMQLVDLHTGRPVAELYPSAGIGGWLEFQPTGRVWVCGSLNSVAALIPDGGDQRRIALGRARHAMFNNKWLLARALVHGQEKPPAQPFVDKRPYGGSTWAADCAQKPTRSGGFSWRYFQVDEGPMDGEFNKARWEDRKLWKALQATGLG